jgi:uncharacterized membrane-anchored protein
MKKILLSILCVTFALTGHAQASDGPKMTVQEFEAKLHYEQGEITLPGNIATLKLSPSFRYLGPVDAEKVISQGWGNPPGAKTLGMIVPADVSPITESGWGVVVTYEKDGHVKDDDADTIKYDELLKDMQQQVQDSNAERTKAGYRPMSLVGWAETPHYDKTSHKLYWAKEIGGDGPSSLNYSVRVLGREGVLVLNAVAGMGQITQMKSEMAKVTAFSEFTNGNRYADFDGKTDKMAEYGLAALVAGGVAAKLGFFGKLLGFLLVFKKLVIIGFGAAAAGLFKLFGRNKDEASAPQEQQQQEPQQPEQPQLPQASQQLQAPQQPGANAGDDAQPKVDLGKRSEPIHQAEPAAHVDLEKH